LDIYGGETIPSDYIENNNNIENNDENKDEN
jgi:hypothetical protein